MFRSETTSTSLLEGTPWATSARDHTYVLIPHLDDVQRPAGSRDHVALSGPSPCETPTYITEVAHTDSWMSIKYTLRRDTNKYYKGITDHKYGLGTSLYSSNSVTSTRFGDRPPDPDPDFDASTTVESFIAESLVARNGLGSDST